MEVLLKGCPAEDCDHVNIYMTYENVIKHLKTECNKIKGKCSEGCDKEMFRNEIDKHIRNKNIQRVKQEMLEDYSKL